MKKATIKTPGKIILSGEHSVVYGCPAIAAAINYFATANITESTDTNILFNLPDFAKKFSCSLKQLKSIKNNLLQKYQQFLDGKIEKVLISPAELIQFTIINFLDYCQLKLVGGLQLEVNSKIPVGCGFGSSAAVILSIIGALAKYFKQNLAAKNILTLAQESENLQHGYASGVDAYTCLHGGCVYFQRGTVKSCNNNLSMFAVNTGAPRVSTGECVAKVAAQFKHSEIWSEFTAVTENLFAALNADNIFEIKKLINENHCLLSQLGVVPAKVQKFIGEIEKINGAAKISGAGSVIGDSAGMVLVLCDEIAAVENLCAHFNYQIMPLHSNIQ